jgi:hypothetical protein
MVRIRVASLALPVVIGIGMTVTSCSSATGTVKPVVSATRSASGAAISGNSTATPGAPGSSGPLPAGYTRVGGAAQGISVAAPASWVTVNLAKESPESALSKAGLSGASATAFVQGLEFLQKWHAFIVFNGYRPTAPTLSFYCDTSGTADFGAAGVPFLKTTELSQLKQLVVTHIAVKDLEIGGVPGVEVSYEFPSSTEGPIHGSELAVLPKPDKVCYVTETVSTGESLGSVLSVAAATAQFS